MSDHNMRQRAKRMTGRMKPALIFILCLFVAFTIYGAAYPARADATSFSSKKPEGQMATAAKGKIAVTW